jgi:hypothetical protein
MHVASAAVTNSKRAERNPGGLIRGDAENVGLWSG